MRSAIAVVALIAISLNVDCVSAQTKGPAFDGVVQPLVARFSGSCLVPPGEVGALIPQSGLATALAGIFIPKVAGVAVDLVGQLLQKAGEDRKSVMQASAGPYLYRVNAWKDKEGRTIDQLPNARCLHLLSFREPAGTSTDWKPVVDGTSRTVEAITRVQTSLGMADRPAPTFYMEFAVVISSDQTSFMLVPTFLKYGRGFGGRKSSTELVAAINVSHPGADNPFASTTVLLRDLEVGKAYDSAALLGSWSEWMPIDRPSEAVSEAKGKPKPKDTNERPLLFDPLNVKTALTETQDGIKLLKALGEALSSTKDAVATAVGNSLPTDDKRKTEETSRLDDRNAYLNAMATVTVKEKGVNGKSGVEKAQAEADVTKAKLDANKAALKAGITLPYGELYEETN